MAHYLPSAHMGQHTKITIATKSQKVKNVFTLILSLASSTTTYITNQFHITKTAFLTNPQSACKNADLTEQLWLNRIRLWLSHSNCTENFTQLHFTRVT